MRGSAAGGRLPFSHYSPGAADAYHAVAIVAHTTSATAVEFQQFVKLQQLIEFQQPAQLCRCAQRGPATRFPQ